MNVTNAKTLGAVHTHTHTHTHTLCLQNIKNYSLKTIVVLAYKNVNLFSSKKYILYQNLKLTCN